MTKTLVVTSKQDYSDLCVLVYKRDTLDNVHWKRAYNEACKLLTFAGSIVSCWLSNSCKLLGERIMTSKKRHYGMWWKEVRNTGILVTIVTCNTCNHLGKHGLGIGAERMHKDTEGHRTWSCSSPFTIIILCQMPSLVQLHCSAEWQTCIFDVHHMINCIVWCTWQNG